MRLLAELARTMLTDFAAQDTLEQVPAQIVEILPVTGAALTVLAPDLSVELVAASDPAALTFARLRRELHPGPSLAAEPVIVPDLAVDTSLRAFSSAATVAGAAAAFSFPLHRGDARLGALDLYCDAPGDLDVHAMETAQVLADVIAAYLVNAQWRERAQRDVHWFRRRALYDPLTGLANRVLLQDRLTHATERTPRADTTYAVLFVDLDRFKQVNDSHGHAVGDQLLVAVAARLSALVRPGDTLARLAGDEFVLLCEALHSTGEVDAIARRVRQAFATPFSLDGLTLTITASVGVARTAPGELPTSQLLVRADHAMYRSKAGRCRTHVLHLDPRPGLPQAHQPPLQEAGEHVTTTEADSAPVVALGEQLRPVAQAAGRDPAARR
ncbi:MAG: sensor domain-containing diguanylate cyclase [Mycobacteriales bacterium]